MLFHERCADGARRCAATAASLTKLSMSKADFDDAVDGAAKDCLVYSLDLPPFWLDSPSVLSVVLSRWSMTPP